MALMETSPTVKGGEFSWKITDQLEVASFLHARPGRRFASKIFKIGGLEWQLFAYPSGKYKKDKYHKHFIEGCEFYLQLISSSWPVNAYKIIFLYRLFCLNASSSFTNIAEFVSRNNQHRHNQNRNSNYFVNWYRGTLTTSELQELEGGIVNLQCSIKVLAMIGRNQYSVIYQYPFQSQLRNLQSIDYEWKIGNIQQLFIDTKCGKHLESNIFHNYWCLRIAPKGWKLKEQRFVCIWLQLCGLPLNISRIDCKYIIKCVETNTFYQGHKKFSYSYKGTNADWNNHELFTNSLKNYDELTFQCKIVITKQFDMNGYPVNPAVNVNHNNINNMNNNNNIKGPYRRKNAENMNDAQPHIPAPAAPINHVHVDHEGTGDNDDDQKSPEMDGLKQEVFRLNEKVSEMQQIITHLQSRVGIDDDDNHTFEDDEKQIHENPGNNMTIIQMLKAMKQEIKMLKEEKFGNNDGQNMSIEQWLRYRVKLPEYIGLFKQNGFDDLKVVKFLKIEDLKEMGVSKYGHRLMIMTAIQDLQKMNDENHTFEANGNTNTNQTSEGHSIYPTPFI